MVADLNGEAAGALGEVVDVGTGRGQLPLLLLELGRATKVTGLDWDAAKIAAASRAADRRDPDLDALDATFSVSDAREAELPAADTVLLVDVLHYFSPDEQDAILDRAAEAVRPGGRLVVREADPSRGWRSTMTRLEEGFFTLVRFNRGERVSFRPIDEIVARLGLHGLRCEVIPAWAGTPFSNVLVVARRDP
jgi:SAM-dependent methyltransferase